MFKLITFLLIYLIFLYKQAEMEGKEIKDEPGKIENMIPIVRAARDHFINSVYGKFDLIQTLLSPETLLYGKPRIIKKIISEKFGISKSEINNDTFWSWLRRNRKNQDRNVTFHKTKQHYVERFQEDDQTIDWKNFTPSNPLIERDTERAIIKLVTATE